MSSTNGVAPDKPLTTPKIVIKSVVVDLTSLRVAGDRQWPDLCCIELLRTLSTSAPQTQFVLLVGSANQALKAEFDGPNVRCVSVSEKTLPRTAPSNTPTLLELARRRLPTSAMGALDRVVHRLWFFALQLRYKRALRRFDADLLYCPSGFSRYAGADLPCVSTLHELHAAVYPEHFPAGDARYLQQYIKAACQHSDMVAAVSGSVRQSAINYTGIDPKKIRHIVPRWNRQLGVDTSDTTDVYGEFGRLPERYLMYPAEFSPVKNHELLLTAYGLARNSGLPKDMGLLCVGPEGERLEWLRRATRAMGLDNHVRFIETGSYRDMIRLLCASSGLVSASLYEGFLADVVTAAMLDVPAACGATHALPRELEKAVITFDPRITSQIARAMVRLVTEQPLHSKLLAAAHQVVTELADSTRMAEEYWNLFEHAVVTHSGRRR